MYTQLVQPAYFSIFLQWHQQSLWVMFVRQTCRDTPDVCNSRISLTKAHVLWWCDNKSNLITVFDTFSLLKDLLLAGIL